MLLEWLILILLFQLSVWPFLRVVSRTFALPLSFPVSLLLATLTSWYLALSGLPVHLVLVPLVLLLGYAAIKRTICVEDMRSGWRWYGLFYGIFLLALLTKLWYDPSIDISYEKFMDSMILSSMMSAPQIPPIDGWYAGGTLTWYYYLAAWVFAVPGYILGIPASVMYNLAIPTVFAVSAVMIYSCSTLLITRFRYLPLFLLIVSYPGFFSLIPLAIGDKTPLRFILDGSVRMILPGAVTENPLSALFIGSPRPYAVALMIQCLIIFLLIYGFLTWKTMSSRSRVCTGLLLSLCLGTLIPLHSWDVIIYLPFTFLMGLLISYQQYCGNSLSAGTTLPSLRSRFISWGTHLRSSRGYPSLFHDDSLSAIICISLITPIVSLLMYLPFILDLDNQRMQGVSLLPTPSDPISFILIHGWFLLLLLVYLRKDIIKRPVLLAIPLVFALAGFIAGALVVIPLVYLAARRFSRIEEILAFAGLMCILFCEFFAMVQNGAPDRANTTYKFYFAAWVLLGISTFSLLGGMLEQFPALRSDRRYAVVTGLLIAGALVFPAILLSSGSMWPPTLDGTAFVSKYIGHEESDALDYLRSLPPGEVLIEGVVPAAYDQDDAAKYFSRVSTYTGIPAVMGSYSREKVYRQNNATIERGEDSVLVYLQPEQAAALMAKHHATLLYVGVPEITLYNIKNPDIYSSLGFTPVFHENQTTIWRVAR